MDKQGKNMYQLCRQFAGLTQEAAIERLPCSLSSLQKYEAENRQVPDDIVGAMAVAYGVPMLAIWHLKETNPLGKYLPEVVMPTTVGDMGFSVFQAREGASRALSMVSSLLEDGKITEDEHHDGERLSGTLKDISGQCLCAATYLDGVCVRGKEP